MTPKRENEGSDDDTAVVPSTLEGFFCKMDSFVAAKAMVIHQFNPFTTQMSPSAVPIGENAPSEQTDVLQSTDKPKSEPHGKTIDKYPSLTHTAPSPTKIKQKKLRRDKTDVDHDNGKKVLLTTRGDFASIDPPLPKENHDKETPTTSNNEISVQKFKQTIDSIGWDGAHWLVPGVKRPKNLEKARVEKEAWRAKREEARRKQQEEEEEREDGRNAVLGTRSKKKRRIEIEIQNGGLHATVIGGKDKNVTNKDRREYNSRFEKKVGWERDEKPKVHPAVLAAEKAMRERNGCDIALIDKEDGNDRNAELSKEIIPVMEEGKKKKKRKNKKKNKKATDDMGAEEDESAGIENE